METNDLFIGTGTDNLVCSGFFMIQESKVHVDELGLIHLDVAIFFFGLRLGQATGTGSWVGKDNSWNIVIIQLVVLVLLSAK